MNHHLVDLMQQGGNLLGTLIVAGLLLLVFAVGGAP